MYMFLRILSCFFLLFCLPVAANQININYSYISYLEKISIEIQNKKNSSSALKVSLPSSNTVTIDTIPGLKNDIITYTPSTVGKHTFLFNGEKKVVWVLKKPSVDLMISKLFVTNMPIKFTIPKRQQKKHYKY